MYPASWGQPNGGIVSHMRRKKAVHYCWIPGSRHCSGNFQGAHFFILYGCLYCWLKEVDCITTPKQKSHRDVQRDYYSCYFKHFLFLHLWDKETQYLSVWRNRFRLELPEIKYSSIEIDVIMMKHIHRFCRRERFILMWMTFVIQTPSITNPF